MLSRGNTKRWRSHMMKEFFGFGGYQRDPEGFLSWQHLLFVSLLVGVMIALALWLGLQNRKKSLPDKNKVLMAAAISIDVIEIAKILLFCIRSDDPMRWTLELPLFLCSIQLITLPLAAFSKGRVKEAALDFVFVFGMLGALLGTYGAGNNYGAYPVLCVDNVVSGITHTISGFGSLYIGISGMASMKKRNIPITCLILTVFCVTAYIVNPLVGGNYMFLVRGDGTPYDILYNLLGGNAILYPISVVLLFFLYIAAFYGVFALCKRRKGKAA
ncbi:MAG: hypothetical protein E7644_07295 [Ruminococcaceae bacterium]|nr:hypothetical protein [Oscillospiraceae bacterium]